MDNWNLTKLNTLFGDYTDVFGYYMHTAESNEEYSSFLVELHEPNTLSHFLLTLFCMIHKILGVHSDTSDLVGDSSTFSVITDLVVRYVKHDTILTDYALEYIKGRAGRWNDKYSMRDVLTSCIDHDDSGLELLVEDHCCSIFRV
jgi:hypothetical protein